MEAVKAMTGLAMKQELQKLRSGGVAEAAAAVDLATLDTSELPCNFCEHAWSCLYFNTAGLSCGCVVCC